MKESLIKQDDPPLQDCGIAESIAKLPQKIRLPLVLHYFHGDSVKIIAQKLDTSTSAVYAKLRTAIKQLHSLLIKQGDIS